MDTKEFKTKISSISEKNQADVFLYIASINNTNADKFIHLLRTLKSKRTNCCLILTTLGGDPDAGYRIIRTIKRHYKKLTLYVFGHCKSAGTLMALGADEIIMSDFGEFGPLDVQLAKEDELFDRTSGLNIIQSLTSLNEQLFRSFEQGFLSIKAKSSGTITTITAMEISSQLAVGLIAPISGQIDPLKLGEIQRSVNIAREYGKRLCAKTELITNLIIEYPSHDFVIDFEEAQKLFGNKILRGVNDDEAIVEQTLLPILRSEG
jgi:Serine dehydrogenase proteinase